MKSAGRQREDVTFESGGDECSGWLYLPGAAQPNPEDPAGPTERGAHACVVMAHGLGATREGGLAHYAERFRARGLAALVFDYRHFGDSGGSPRELIDIGRQHADWQAAVAFARSRHEIDADRVALWGSSFSGGHVIWLAAHDERIAAVVSQVPHASGPMGVAATGAKRVGYFTYAALRDEFNRLLGREPFYIPIVGPPGSMATLTSDGASSKYMAMYPDGSEPPNRGAARLGLRIGTYSPVRYASKVRCPLLVVVGEDDTITPPAPARKLAERAPDSELIRFPGGHFDVYFGETFERVSDAEAEFLARKLASQIATAQ